MNEPPEQIPFRPPLRTWRAKFADAFRGLGQGMRGQNSFAVHIGCAAAVVVAAAVLGLAWNQWSLLLLCIALVLAAEMFNSALEAMARAITAQFNPHLRSALNMGSAAVLLTAMGAAAVGAIVFLRRLGEMAAWW
jgi:diacylglycerol kinase